MTTGPISLHEENPRYFTYRGKPTVLIASAEHYGAVLNGAFDYRKYLKELRRCGNNLTRVFTGVYREFPGCFYDAYNTLAPRPQDFLCPYRRTEADAANDAQKKFDLDAWDEAYFDRLEAFMREAEKRNVVVELAFFCPFYTFSVGNSAWNLSPWHPDNNVNGVGRAGPGALFTWEDADFIRVQTALVKELVTRLNRYDNLMYEIMNEPYWGGISDRFEPAVSALVEETEKGLPKKHLVTQNIANGSSKVESADPRVSAFNWHYASPPTAVAENYALNKPVGCNETGFSSGNADGIFRKQAWEFILAGGALFNNLDFSFAVGNEAGEGVSLCPHTGGSHALRRQLGFLRAFMEGMDFVRMRPANERILSGETGSNGYLLAEPGRQYAYYLAKDVPPRAAELDVAAGTYRYEAVDPAKCLRVESGTFVHAGGARRLPLERYAAGGALEIAVRLTATPEGAV